MNRREVSAGDGCGDDAVDDERRGGRSSAATSDVVYELRIYHANEGKLDALLARFRDHTIAIFDRHGLKLVGFWTPTDEPLKGKTLIYILKHPSREAATANWKSVS